MRTVHVIKKSLTSILSFSKYIFLLLNLKFHLVYNYMLKKIKVCVYKNITKTYVLRHISWKAKGAKKLELSIPEHFHQHFIGNRKFSNFRFFRFFSIFYFYQVFNCLCKSHKCPNQILM